MKRFQVSSESSILVGPGCTAGSAFSDLGADVDRVFCLYDPNVEKQARAIADSLGASELIEVQGGEKSKSLGTVGRICEQLRQYRCTRRSVIVNIGGGVVTDIGGFVASVYMRGVEFVNVPTSMLGMCDAAIGGKNGVHLGCYKNLLGTFRQPRKTLIDPDLLATLPAHQLREGLVEIVKMAAILDVGVFEWLEANMDSVLTGASDARTRCIEKAVQMKVEVVRADAMERERRMLLNFGHTLGHGLEALSGFATTHGCAVSIGMVWEMELAGTQGRERVVNLLRRLELPIQPDDGLDFDGLWEAIRSDKKCVGDTVRMAVPLWIGHGALLELREDQLCS